jgi:hypothetical protein
MTITGQDINNGNLDRKELPGDWKWRKAFYTRTGKVNIYFELNADRPNGWIGEIDNYPRDGEEKWDLCVRCIKDNGTVTGRPEPEPNTKSTFSSLREALDAVPEHIMENNYELSQ